MSASSSRRGLIAGALALAGGALLRRPLAAAEGSEAWPEGWTAPEAACRAPAAATARQTEGPFFTPGTPRARDLRSAGGPGRPLDLVGRLQDRDCRPLAGAVVELWHADAEGRYDNAGFRFRGHQVADGQGRTRHYHLILAPDGGRPLTTQLYFPDEPGNARDRLFDASLQMRLERQGETLVGRYDFVAG
jgi:protocatechuate 3,4-dioxygenase beta subunit